MEYFYEYEYLDQKENDWYKAVEFAFSKLYKAKQVYTTDRKDLAGVDYLLTHLSYAPG